MEDIIDEPSEVITWDKLLSDFTAGPLETVTKTASLLWGNLQEKYWVIILLIVGFWLSRKLVFTLVNFVVPRSVDDSFRLPRWAKVRALSDWRKRFYNSSLQSRAMYRARTVVALTKSMVDPFMGMIAFFMVFGQLGISVSRSTTGWLIGGLTIAVGLGVQSLVKDIIAGLTIVLGKVYDVGDYVDTLFGVAGTVKKIGVRMTILEGTDGTLWAVRHSELSKVGNRTASRARVVTDVTLTWNEDDKHITMEDLRFAETTLDFTVRNLADTLEGVDRVARDQSVPTDQMVPLRKIAGVVPDLIPNMPAETMWEMKELDGESTGQHRIVASTVQKLRGQVPVFTLVETLGLVNSTPDSVTLRLRITLPPDTSRSQAMAVLRRQVFETFVEHRITPTFDDVPEGNVVLSTRDREAL